MTIGLSSCRAFVLLASLLVLGGNLAAQQAPLLQRLVSFFGLNADPSQMRDSEEELLRGAICMADLTTGATQRLTTEDMYRSPIFLPGGDLLALKGEMLVRIGTGGAATSLRTVEGVDKLVAANAHDPDQILLVRLGEDGSPVPTLLSLEDGTLTPVEVDWQSEGDVLGLAHLEGWDRSYDDMQLRVQRMRATGFAGIREWTDVFLFQKGREPQNVSACGDVDCGQPSLSFGRDKVAFIKGAR